MRERKISYCESETLKNESMVFRLKLNLFAVLFVWILLQCQSSAHAQLFWNPDETLCQENPCINGGSCINFRRPNVGRQPVNCSLTSCYKVFESSNDHVTWAEARRTCRDHGGDLVSLENPKEQSYVASYVQQLNSWREDKITDFWTSGAYSEKYDKWLWNNENYHFILNEQVPLEGSRNHCLLVNLNSGNLQSESCGHNKKFICELSKETLVKEWTYSCLCPEDYYGYHCEHFIGITNVSVCEGRYLNITCPVDASLYIERAYFGPDNSLCEGNGPASLEPTQYPCSKTSILSWLQIECGGKRTCLMEVVANLPGYNSCPERKKLLDVQYRCFVQQRHTQFFCERTQATLSKCPSSSKILIEYANYGRMNKTLCTVNNQVETTDFCRATDSLSIVAEKCNNNNSSCTFQAENRVFGDPCNGVFKYLETRYQCIEGDGQGDPVGFRYPPVPGSVPPTTVPPVTHCGSTTRLGLDWPTTEIGEKAMVNCFGHEDVFATWQCSRQELGWHSSGPNVTLCPSNMIYDIEREILNGSVPASGVAMLVTEWLDTDEGVSQEELRHSVHLMDVLLTKQMTQLDDSSGKKLQTTLIDFNQAMLELGSALLDTDRSGNWLEESQGSLGNQTVDIFDITTLLESCSFLLADQLTGNKTVADISTKNIKLEVAKIDVKDDKREKFSFPHTEKRENGNDEKDSKYKVDIPTDVPKKVNSSKTLLTMSVLVYKTLDTLLSTLPNQEELNESLSSSQYDTQLGYNSTAIIASVVLGVSIKANGVDVTNLGDEEIELTFHHLNQTLIGKTTCVFWDDQANDNRGGWESFGCRSVLSNQSETRCACNHLTNFAILMDVTGSHADLSEGHTIALELISIIGCTVSIISLLLCVIVFSCFRDLKNLRTSIHRNLCLTLMIAEILFLCGVNLTNLKLVCTLVAVSLHYFFLTAFVWMCLEGIQLYVMLVHVFHTNSKVLPYYLVGYGVPAIIVGVAAALKPSGYGTDYYCWLSVDDGLIWSFAGPVLFIIFVNMVFLTRALRVAYSKSSSIQKDSQKIPNIRSWIKGGITLTFLLGTTWTIGFAFISAETVVMAYAFTILNSLQGLFIFFFHCVGNERVKREIIRALLKQDWVPKAVKRRLMKSESTSTMVSTTGSQYTETKGKTDADVSTAQPSDINLLEDSNDKRKTQVFFTNPLIKIHDMDEATEGREPPRQSWLHKHGVHEANSEEYISNYPEPDYY